MKIKWPITRWSTVRKDFEELKKYYILKCNQEIYDYEATKRQCDRLLEQVHNLNSKINGLLFENESFRRRAEDEYFAKEN